MMFIIKGLLFTPAKLREAFPEKHSTSIFRCWFFDVLKMNNKNNKYKSRRQRRKQKDIRRETEI